MVSRNRNIKPGFDSIIGEECSVKDLFIQRGSIVVSGISVVAIRMWIELFFDKGKIVCATSNKGLEFVKVLWP